MKPKNHYFSVAITSVLVVLLSMTAFPMMAYLDNLPQMENSQLVFAAGIIIPFIAILFMSYLLSPPGVSVYFIIFSVFAFTSIVDLNIGMTLENLYYPYATFYLLKGEPYLRSSYGSAINWWDGTFHYFLYIAMVFSLASRRNFRWLGFIWVGSILNSVIVFLPGNIIGIFGKEIRESFFLNVPYVCLPIIFAIKQFQDKSPAKLASKNPKIVRGRFLALLDIFLIIWLIFAIGFAIFRALVVGGAPISYFSNYIDHYEPILNDLSKWPQLQVAVYACYFVPFYLIALYSLLYPSGKTWFPDLAAIHLGAAWQAQFSFIYPATRQIPSYPSTFPNHTFVPVPSSARSVFWMIHLSLVVVPLLLFVRVCWVNQAFWSKNKQKTQKKK